MSVHWGGRGFGHVSRNTSPTFNPLALFAGGLSGIWLDPSDLTTLFQNSNGTTAVTADGDPVGYIADKSGNGNHATQATSGKRPLYKTSGGLSWLQFDGTDDCLQIASCALPTFIYLALGMSQTSSSAKQFFIEQSADASGNDGFWFFGSSTSTWLFRRSAADQHAAGTSGWAGTALGVAELSYNGTGTYSLDGVAQSNGSISGTARADSNVTAALNIYSRNQASVFSQARLYGLIISPYATGQPQQAKARTYMAAKQGRAL